MPSGPATLNVMFRLTFQAPCARLFPVLLPCTPPHNPLSNVARRSVVVGIIGYRRLHVRRCSWCGARAWMLFLWSLFATVHYCCCCRCRGGWEARCEKGLAWLFSHFQVNDFDSPSTAKLGDSSGGCPHTLRAIITLMEHLQKLEKVRQVSCDIICYKNEPNIWEEHCANYYIW